MSEPCGMCQGTGKVETLQYLDDGAQVYVTTDATANIAIYMDQKRRGTKGASISCKICDGSGITPVPLTDSYWQGRSDEADEQLDQSFFGLGKFIRKAIEKSE